MSKLAQSQGQIVLSASQPGGSGILLHAKVRANFPCPRMTPGRVT
jgi:hypothetical protein